TATQNRKIDRNGRFDEISGIEVAFLIDGVAGLVHHIGVVPGAALQNVRTSTTVKKIVAVIPREPIAGGISDRRKVSSPEQTLVLDGAAEPRRQIDRKSRANLVIRIEIAFLFDRVSGIDQINIVPRASLQRVSAGATIERVVARIAGELIVDSVADSV